MYQVTITGPLGVDISTMQADNGQLWNTLHNVSELLIGEDTAVVKDRSIEGDTITLDCSITRELEDERLRAWIGDILSNVAIQVVVKRA